MRKEVVFPYITGVETHNGFTRFRINETGTPSVDANWAASRPTFKFGARLFLRPAQWYNLDQAVTPE